MQRLQIRADESGARLDRVLCDRLSLSRAQAKRLFEGGEVRRNGRRAGKGDLVAEGDLIELGEELRSAEALPDPEVPLDFLYQDEYLVAVNKPAGVPCHPLRPGELGCMANGLLARFPEMADTGYDSRQPGLVNRLDNDTTGILLAARTASAFAGLRALLETGGFEKRYLALTERPLKAQHIELPLAPSPRHRARVEVTSLGRPASSEVRSCTPHGESQYVIEVRADRAYRHQVRVHLSAVGAPIVGDQLYGGALAPRHYLHAWRLQFVHPVTKRPVELLAKLPGDWPLDASLEPPC